MISPVFCWVLALYTIVTCPTPDEARRNDVWPVFYAHVLVSVALSVLSAVI